MTPGGRAAAAIDILADILTGAPAERTLTRWARSSRFAGSRDRAAIRDLVFGCLRRRRSFAWTAGVSSDITDVSRVDAVPIARGLVAACLWEDPAAAREAFSGEGHAPPPLTADEVSRLGAAPAAATLPVALDFPDFLEGDLQRSLGSDLRDVMSALQSRAPVDLRVNTLRGTVAQAVGYLEAERITTRPLDGAATALRVLENPRAVMGSTAYRRGLVELQDLSSQLVAAAVPVAPGQTVLDYCAGGGGKTLALAARTDNQALLFAHDVNTGRTRDLPARAARAGAQVRLIETDALKPLRAACDVVLADAPCSGSGAWRRNPEAKWRMTAKSLQSYVDTQDQVLDNALRFVRPGGCLVYATCSLLACENQDRIADFLQRHPGVTEGRSFWLNPAHDGDGFYFCELFIP